ncbi:MAG: outer membrane beta-barrel protein [bacterium]
MLRFIYHLNIIIIFLFVIFALLINTKAEEIDKKGVFEPSVDFNAVNLKFNTSTFNFFAPCLNLDYKIDRYKISLSYLFGQDSEQVGNFDFKVKINDLSARLSYRLIKQDNSKLYFNTNLKSFKLSSEWGNLSDSDTWSGLGVGLGYEFNKDKYGIDLNLNYYPTLDSSNIPDYSLFELSAVFRYTINPKLQAYLNVVSNKFNSLDNNSDIDYTRFGIGLKFKI